MADTKDTPTIDVDKLARDLFEVSADAMEHPSEVGAQDTHLELIAAKIRLALLTAWHQGNRAGIEETYACVMRRVGGEPVAGLKTMANPYALPERK